MTGTPTPKLTPVEDGKALEVQLEAGDTAGLRQAAGTAFEAKAKLFIVCDPKSDTRAWLVKLGLHKYANKRIVEFRPRTTLPILVEALATPPKKAAPRKRKAATPKEEVDAS